MNARARGGPPEVMPDSVIDDLARRFTGYATPREPVEHGREDTLQVDRSLPPQPGPRTPSALRDAWNRAFGRKLNLQPFQFSAERVREAGFRSATRQLAVPLGPGRTETSSNWAGAYISANEGRPLGQVWGFWTVPGVLRPTSGDETVEYRCANWIGLDGQRRYVDSSLPQAGTTSILHPDGTVSAMAWTQWWARQDPKSAPVPLGLPVKPGDAVACVLSALGPHDVGGVMVNLGGALPTAMAFRASAPDVVLDDGRTTRPSIFGATAEWVVERPQLVGDTRRWELPDFTSCDFEGCLAVAADTSGGGLSDGQVRDLTGARLIRMLDIKREPDRTAIITMTARLSDTAVRVKYGGF